jgi:hypothetical protein
MTTWEMNKYGIKLAIEWVMKGTNNTLKVYTDKPTSSRMEWN